VKRNAGGGGSPDSDPTGGGDGGGVCDPQAKRQKLCKESNLIVDARSGIIHPVGVAPPMGVCGFDNVMSL
jgi:hypothetical protein